MESDRHHRLGRTCSRCPKPIVDHSKLGICHSCFMVEFNADPEQRRRRAEGARRLYRENPEAYAKRVKTVNRNRDKALADPAMREKFRLHGLKMMANFHTPEALAKKEAAREGVRAAISATKLAWCPEQYRARYLVMTKKKRIKAAVAREIILQIAADEQALPLIDSALEYLRRFAPVAKLEEGFRYGNAILRPSEVIDRARVRGWQPERWAA